MRIFTFTFCFLLFIGVNSLNAQASDLFTEKQTFSLENCINGEGVIAEVTLHGVLMDGQIHISVRGMGIGDESGFKYMIHHTFQEAYKGNQKSLEISFKADGLGRVPDFNLSMNIAYQKNSKEEIKVNLFDIKDSCGPLSTTGQSLE